MPDVETPTSAEPLVFEQRAKLSSFVGLSLKNGLLNLVTLTLYRFWGKTEVRRRLWHSTYLNGESFEYTGRGSELFLGFLIALAIIGLPFLLAGFAVQFAGPVAALVLFPLLYLGLFVLMGFGRFTAFRYLASRTSWRGVRFQLTGSPLRYGFKFLGNLLLSAITLGWWWPAAELRLAQPLWSGLKFGDRQINFDLACAKQERLYGAYAIGWVVMVIAYTVGMGFITGARLAANGVAPEDLSLAFVAVTYAALFILVLLYCIAFAPYHAALLRAVVSGIGVDGARFKLDLRWTEIAWLWLSNILLLTFTVGFLMPFVEARTGRFLIQRLRAAGDVDLSGVQQAAALGPRTGEGLADAFGMATI